jgi:hypothetical protein
MTEQLLEYPNSEPNIYYTKEQINFKKKQKLSIYYFYSRIEKKIK